MAAHTTAIGTCYRRQSAGTDQISLTISSEFLHMWGFALPWSHIVFLSCLICPHASSQCLVGLATLSQHRFRSWNGMSSSRGSPIIHGRPEPTQEIPAICLVSELTLISMTVNISQNLTCPDPRVPLLSKYSLGRHSFCSMWRYQWNGPRVGIYRPGYVTCTYRVGTYWREGGQQPICVVILWGLTFQITDVLSPWEILDFKIPVTYISLLRNEDYLVEGHS